MTTPIVKCFFENDTETAQFVVACPNTKAAAILDSVMDYSPAACRLTTGSCDAICAHIAEHDLDVKYILDTHVHADHVSGMAYLKTRYPGAKTGIGSKVTVVQDVFKQLFNLDDLHADGAQFDLLLEDGQEFTLGDVQARVMHTPGHTPACACYIFGDAIFTGDTVFMPDVGTARCDFPGGSVDDMYDSTQKILSLPETMRVFVGHDYPPQGAREWSVESTIAEQRAKNKHVKVTETKESFAKFRSERDAVLKPPRYILPSLQINLKAGRFPEPESNGTSYLKLPINVLGK